VVGSTGISPVLLYYMYDMGTARGKYIVKIFWKLTVPGARDVSILTNFLENYQKQNKIIKCDKHDINK